jgi:hypothetical protein
MINVLKNEGFTYVKEFEYQRSAVQAFKNIDTPGHIRALHSSVIEATVPW